MNPTRTHETTKRRGTPGAGRRWQDIDFKYRFLSKECFSFSDSLRVANSFNQLALSAAGKLVALPIHHEGEVRYIVASQTGQGDFRAKVDLFIAGWLAGRQQ